MHPLDSGPVGIRLEVGGNLPSVVLPHRLVKENKLRDVALHGELAEDLVMGRSTPRPRPGGGKG